MQVWVSPSVILTVVRDPVIVVVIIDSVSETIAIRVVVTWEMEIITNMACMRIKLRSKFFFNALCHK